jgi:hypothetical protein
MPRYKPALQLVQAAAAGPEYEPASQFAHAARNDPSAAPKVLAAQPGHGHNAAGAAAAEMVPAAHGVQPAAPAADWYWPAAHGLHAVDAVPPTSLR